MNISRTSTQLGTGRIGRVWPILLVLLSATLVPTACVLWFMNAAMENERLAGRQRLSDAYGQYLQGKQALLAEFWQQKIDGLQCSKEISAAEAFGRLCPCADGIVIRDESGRVLYPDAAPPEVGGPPAALRAAQEMEFRANRPEEAAAMYEAQAQLSPVHGLATTRAAVTSAPAVPAGEDVSAQAQALLGQGRCLINSGQTQQGLAILKGMADDPRWAAARDGHGDLIVANAQLLAVTAENLQDLSGTPLRRMVNDYSLPMPSAQRLFLLQQAASRCAPAEQERLWPTLPAELLSAEYVQAAPAAPAHGAAAQANARLWHALSLDGRVVGLFDADRLMDPLRRHVQWQDSPAGTSVRLEKADPAGGSAASSLGGDQAFLRVPACRQMPGWQLAIYLSSEDPMARALQGRRALYLWTGGAGILLICLMAMALAGYVGRQMRLTRLKNDLIATVSHELKTPLSSIRVLVDTLLAGRCPPGEGPGYFGLIARENQRLSRLIDNFMTFSRMERSKRTFDVGPVDLAEVAKAAAQTLEERLTCPGCRLELLLPNEPILVQGDRDALLTVVLNLLDNAWKYSGQEKHIALAVSRQAGKAVVCVSDNGVGMSRRSMRRIFDRFYQVDRTLSRKAGGCGLGLSIVKFIVETHGGGIDVRSQLGKGSTFRIVLPARGD